MHINITFKYKVGQRLKPIGTSKYNPKEIVIQSLDPFDYYCYKVLEVFLERGAYRTSGYSEEGLDKYFTLISHTYKII